MFIFSIIIYQLYAFFKEYISIINKYDIYVKNMLFSNFEISVKVNNKENSHNRSSLSFNYNNCFIMIIII